MDLENGNTFCLQQTKSMSLKKWTKNDNKAQKCYFNLFK